MGAPPLHQRPACCPRSRRGARRVTNQQHRFQLNQALGRGEQHAHPAILQHIAHHLLRFQHQVERHEHASRRRHRELAITVSRAYRAVATRSPRLRLPSACRADANRRCRSCNSYRSSGCEHHQSAQHHLTLDPQKLRSSLATERIRSYRNGQQRTAQKAPLSRALVQFLIGGLPRLAIARSAKPQIPHRIRQLLRPSMGIWRILQRLAQAKPTQTGGIAAGTKSRGVPRPGKQLSTLCATH